MRYRLTFEKKVGIGRVKYTEIFISTNANSIWLFALGMGIYGPIEASVLVHCLGDSFEVLPTAMEELFYSGIDNGLHDTVVIATKDRILFREDDDTFVSKNQNEKPLLYEVIRRIEKKHLVPSRVLETL